MKLAMFGVVLGLVTACGGKKEADQMTTYADQMCACKTIECAEKIFPEIEKFTAKNEGKTVEATAADNYNRQLERTQKCYDKLNDDAEKAEAAKEAADKPE